VGHFLGVSVAAAGRPQVTLIASVGTIPLALLSCLLLIPEYGAAGAGISFSVISIGHTLLRLAGYVKVSGCSIKETLLPTHRDLAYYRHAAMLVRSRFVRGSESSNTSKMQDA
jgi:O-antigen/teichoic acid export membrane protein